jgi:hypothetical protein
MAIVTIQCPLSVSRVGYGRVGLHPDGAGQLVVPDYVAKTMLTLPGVTGPALTESAAALLAAVDEDFETNYLFLAFGRPLPDDNKVSAASALLAANGEPAVSAT